MMKPIFDLPVYAQRRARLLEQMDDAVVVLVAAPPRIKSHDVEYPYRPSSDILYLTGFEEPRCVVVLRTGETAPNFVLFVQDRDPERERWDGHRAGVEGAKDRYAAEEAYPVSSLREELEKLVSGRRHLFYALNQDRDTDRTLFAVLDGLKGTRVKPHRAPTSIVDPRPLLAELRRVKSEEEITLMREAVAIAAEAHIEAIKTTRPGQMEFEVAALFQYIFQRRGASGTSFDTIVGGGSNATFLHYHQNEYPLEEGTLVLIDAGAEYHYYASDITRTFPVGPAFSAAQADLYQAVLEVQKGVIGRIQPGTSIHELNRWSQQALTQALMDLGLLRGELDALVDEEAYKPFYMHGIGHYLGMDTHDVGTYLVAEDQPLPLEPGVVFTVEPGLYIPPETEGAPEDLRGLGVRIEDDVLVTATGVEVLSADIPKEISEIERLRQEAFR